MVDRSFPEWQATNFILILVPTRELVTQVFENLNTLNQHTGLTSLFLYGGVGYDEQKAALKKPFQFILAFLSLVYYLLSDGFVVCHKLLWLFFSFTAAINLNIYIENTNKQI